MEATNETHKGLVILLSFLLAETRDKKGRSWRLNSTPILTVVMFTVEEAPEL